MRLIRTAIFSFTLLAFCACNDAPRTDNNFEPNQTDTLNRTNSNRETSSDTLSNSSTQADSSHVLHGQDRSKLYKDLGMSDDQIVRFEEDFGRKVDAIKTHGRGDYTAQDVENQEGQSMNAVLSKDQYKNYLDWKEIHLTPKE